MSNDSFSALDHVSPDSGLLPVDSNAEMIGAAWGLLRTVYDPEIGLDIVTLGLVYGVEVEGPVIRVTLTLTTPACPLEEVITSGIEGVLYSLPDIDLVETEVVWEPRWHPGMIQEVE